MKTTQEVPPISGEDYENPEHRYRRENPVVIDPSEMPKNENVYSGNVNMRTGLPVTTPGHDSMLLGSARKEQETPMRDDVTGKVYNMTGSKSQVINTQSHSLRTPKKQKLKSDDIDTYGLKANLYADSTANSTF